ncbi:hypothetical protein JCM11641_007693 [Rhodosporidiobolus odoratus]
MAPSVLYMTFLEPYLKQKNPIPKVSLEGRTVLLEAAIHFGRRSPARLILAVRTIATGETAADRIAEESGLPRDRIQVWQLDLSAFANVKAFGAKARRELNRLDVVCLNAAVAAVKFKQTADGWEETLQVNDIATGLLAVELLPLLLKTAELPTPAGGDNLKPHLTIVASDIHYAAAFKERQAVPYKHSDYLAALNDKELFNGFDRYGVSKVLNVLLARELAKLPQVQSKVVVNSVNPGLTKSSLRREMPWFFEWLFNLLGRDTAGAATNYAYAGLAETEGGAFVSRCAVQEPSDFVLSQEGKEVSKKVFEEMIEVWRKEDPDATAAIFK